jgi:hypothetical protein
MATNAVPYNQLAGPIEVYRAPTGTAFPLLSAAPAVDWVLIGANGSKDYAESGVIVRFPEDVTEFGTLGRTGIAKTFRNREGMEVEFTLHDWTQEAWIQALNKATTDITTVAAASGVPGTKSVPSLRGFNVPSYAWLLRCGASGYGADFKHQIEIPLGQNVGQPEVIYTKNNPIGLHFLVKVLEDATLGFGTIKMEHTPALA